MDSTHYECDGCHILHVWDGYSYLRGQAMQAWGTAASLKEKLEVLKHGEDVPLSNPLCLKCWNKGNTPLPERVHVLDPSLIQSNTLQTHLELRESIAEEIEARKEAKQTRQEKVWRARYLTKLHHHPTGRPWTRAESANKRTKRGALVDLVQRRAQAAEEKLTDQQAATLTGDL